VDRQPLWDGPLARALEGLGQVSWADQERRVLHHFAVLMPCLTAGAKRDLQSAVLRVANRLAIEADETNPLG
jgi:hypothetical protein